MAIKIGVVAKNTVTGLEGRVVARTEHISGLVQVELQPALDKEGKWQDSRWFTEDQVEVTGDQGGKLAKPGKATKSAEPEEEEPAEEAEEQQEEEAAEEEEGGFLDEEGEPTAPALEDVILACQKHSKKHGREKTLALLEKKWKVKSVKKLKPEQYGEVIEALKVK